MPHTHSAPNDDPCHQLEIADNSVGHVTLCAGCGQVHLSLAHVTLRFTPEAFRAMAQLAITAQVRLEHVGQAGTAAAAVIDAARHGPNLH
ncbi:MAG: hypothetical protein V4631_03850 [Pseudomonadota bacterium]